MVMVNYFIYFCYFLFVFFPITLISSLRLPLLKLKTISSRSSHIQLNRFSISTKYYPSSPKKLFGSIPPTPPNNIEANNNVEEAKDLKGRIRVLWSKYGYIAVGTYFSLYVTTLVSIFLSLDLDIFNAANFGFDPKEAVKKVCNLVETLTGNQALPGYIRENPKVGTLAIAWVMTKFTEPIRIGITLAGVPTIARLLGKVPIEPAK